MEAKVIYEEIILRCLSLTKIIFLIERVIVEIRHTKFNKMSELNQSINISFLHALFISLDLTFHVQFTFYAVYRDTIIHSIIKSDRSFKKLNMGWRTTECNQAYSRHVIRELNEPLMDCVADININMHVVINVW